MSVVVAVVGTLVVLGVILGAVRVGRWVRRNWARWREGGRNRKKGGLGRLMLWRRRGIAEGQDDRGAGGDGEGPAGERRPLLG